MAIACTGQKASRLSVSVTFQSVNGTDSISNAALVAACPQRGPLRNLLTTSWGSFADFNTAWAQAGGILALSSASANAKAVWSLSGGGSGLPQLTVTDTVAAFATARVALSFSPTR